MTQDLGALSGSREPDPQAVPALSGFDPARVAAKMSDAQKRWLREVCRTSGGGVSIACRVLDDGEVVPANGPLRKLFDKGLIQGKSGAYERVVHTRDGLAVARYLETPNE